MTALVSPLEPHELPKDMRKGLESIVQRVSAQSAVRGNGMDLLLRIYMAGVYHGMELSSRLKQEMQDDKPVANKADEIRPLFSCQCPDCAAEVSFYADMLRLHNGKPICEECYDAENWVCDDADPPPFNLLPTFVPPWEDTIAALRAEVERLREVLAEIAEATKRQQLPITAQVHDIASAALKGQP